jgi:transcriptional regulator with XRE-family HTH domain
MGESPAVARRRVSLALRAAREAKGLTQAQVADAMEWSLSKVMRIEGGGVSVSVSDLKALLPYLELDEDAEQLVQDAKVARRQRYSVDPLYREHLSSALLQLMQFEQEAVAIRYFHPLIVPGMLQTPAYASAIFRLDLAGLSEETIKVRIEARLERRRRLLARSIPPRYLAILDESVLHREIGGPKVMGEQLRALSRLMREAGFLIRVLPFTDAVPIALLGPFGILDMGDAREVLYREGPRSDAIVRRPREIAEHRDIFERLWPLAYDDADSARLIEKQAEALLAPAPRGRPLGS